MRLLAINLEYASLSSDTALFTYIAVMQATFHPSETIQDVMDHVTECLTDQFRASKFYLYVTPPTQKLATSKTLIELNLVPAALTYLSWVEAPPASDVTSAGYHFRSDLVMPKVRYWTVDEC